MAYGYKDAPPGTYGTLGKLTYQKRWIDDNSFNRMVFLKNFSGLFKSPRLILNVNNKPEYSLTATFSKTTDIKNGEPMSCLAIVLSFNGGQGCYDGLSFSWFKDRFPIARHYKEIMSWVTTAAGNDIATHIPLMAAKVNIGEIGNKMTAFEQIPISAEFMETPDWCNEPGYCKDKWRVYLNIIVSDFKTAAPPEDDASHPVRIIVRAQKGIITNGEVSTEDRYARVFTLMPSEVATSSRVTIKYTPPEGEDNSDIVTVYNSCDVYYTSEVPLSKSHKGSMLIEAENRCGWEGTISKIETMEAGENESLLASLTTGGEYDLSKNWKIELKLKRTGDRNNAVKFEIDHSKLLDFQDNFDATLTKMEREGRIIEANSKENAKASAQPLNADECSIKLLIDKANGQYWITGNIDVEGIPIRGKDEMNIKVKPINKEIDEGAEGTTGINERIEISGRFKTEGPDKVPLELKGSKDLLQDLTEEFKKFLEGMGGKQTQILKWDLRRENTIIRKG